MSANEIPVALGDEIASWRRVFSSFSAHQPHGNARPLLRNAAKELWTALQVSRTVHPDLNDIAQQEVVDALHDMAQLAGISADDAQAIFASSFKEQPEGLNGTRLDDADLGDVATANPTFFIKPSKDFVAGFVPPDYIIHGLLQEGFLYSLTGATGAGKTAITLRLAASVALGVDFAGCETKKRRVLYLAAENPDDVRMRWIALSQHMQFERDDIEVFFIEDVFKISQMTGGLTKKAKRLGGDFGLVIIDTGPVFYEGDDENNRTQQGEHAKMLRDLITIIPGKPTVLANCHPVKNANAENLVPAGGGNFLNQVDGNLTASKDDSTTTLHWQGKFRGVDFAPMYFMIKTVTHELLKDSNGGLIPTVISTWLTDEGKKQIEQTAEADRRRVLAIVAANPTITQPDLAIKMGWTLHGGAPHKVKAGRYLKALRKSQWLDDDNEVTEKGRKVLSSMGNSVTG
jgi:AAA domain